MSLAFDLEAARGALDTANQSGWLLYDFHGQNPIARAALGLERAHLTRRWFYYVPLSGEPTLLAHKIERRHFPDLPGRVVLYSARGELQRALREVLGDAFSVAMEYYPLGAIPYLSRVDAGTVEWVRSLGVDVASSHSLVSALLCAWTDVQRDQHKAAVDHLVAAKDAALTWTQAQLSAGLPVHEADVQEHLLKSFEAAGLETDHAPIVAVGSHAGDPHYSPGADSAALVANQVLLIDLWARLRAPGAPYGDLTFMTWIGPDEVDPEVQVAFDAVTGARDAALELIRSRWEAGEQARGFELDQAARRVIQKAGLGEFFTHRTGHNLGIRSAHGDGPHLDDLETRDDRVLTPRLGFTIEPGVYRPERGFGIRSEIDVYFCPERGPVSFSEPQHAWHHLDPRPTPDLRESDDPVSTEAEA